MISSKLKRNLICVAAFIWPALVLDASTCFAEESVKFVRASDFGYSAEDSTQALQDAIDSGADVVVIDRQSGPWITKTLNLRSNLELVLEEGVELLAKSGEFKRLGEVLLRADNTTNLTIRGEGNGATIRMRKRDYWTAPYDKSEWRHGISLLSASNVTIENLQIAETGGDGIYVGVSGTTRNPCRNVTIRKVDCVENNRQGISVISVDGLLIEDCVLRNTNGTPPAAGVDFEPNCADEQITNVTMRRVIAIDNEGDGFTFYLPQLRRRGHELSFTIEDCASVRNAGVGFSINVANGEEKLLDGKMLVKDTRFIGNRLGIAIRSKWSQGASLAFENVTLETIAADLAQGRKSYDGLSANPDFSTRLDAYAATTMDSGIAIIATGADEYVNGGITFRNVEIVDASESTQEKPLFLLRDASANGVGFDAIGGEIVSTNLTTGETFATSLKKESLAELFPALMARRVPTWDLETLNRPEGKELSDELVAAWRERAKRDDFRPSPVFIRGSAEYWLYLESEQEATATFRQRQIGDYPVGAVAVTIVDPDGATETLERGGSTSEDFEITIQRSNAGWRRIEAEYGASALELVDANVPVLVATRPKLDAFSSLGRYDFYVPQGSSDLGIRVIGSATEPVTVRVWDPDGVEAAALVDVDALGVWSVELDDAGTPIAPKSGFWTLQIERPSFGVLEDYIIKLQGIPALIR